MTATHPAADHHHVFTDDGTHVAVWGGPMTEADAKAEAHRLSNEPGFTTIWVAHYDQPCLHGHGVPNPDWLETQPPFWQRARTSGGVSSAVPTELT